MNTSERRSSDPSMHQQLELLTSLVKRLQKTRSVSEKLAILNQTQAVQEYLLESSVLTPFVPEWNQEQELVVKSILALGQGPIVFRDLDRLEHPEHSLKHILKLLLEVEHFYENIGGIIGYHATVLKLILEKDNPSSQASQNVNYLKPQGEDISKATPNVLKSIRIGIENLHGMAEIYPVGGAGDRLGLTDEKTGTPLPAAELKFLGHTLLEGLFRDLEAREHLYYKLIGKKIWTPVALMTSHEKDNHTHILAICEFNQWFGRPRESFRFFIQPMVPVITIKGDWSMTGPLQIAFKPGGHGMLWKAAEEAHIFDWLISQNREKILIRQINNPCAGTDHGLLAFLGFGFKNRAVFGFASCPRLLNAHEGMNVLIETKTDQGYEYRLTNIEYTDFEIKHIQDVPQEKGSPYSAFPSNTNILFADIKEIKKMAENCPIPGLLINMKTKVSSIDKDGNKALVEGGRLESTMQNIADDIVEVHSAPLTSTQQYHSKTFITFNLRRKTIAVTKSLYEKGKSPVGTPEGTLFDILENYRDLFVNHCGFDLPPLGTIEEYLEKGPPFFILLHPSLGPLFSIIQQKIKSGRLAWGAELQIEIPEIQIDHLNLTGSLRILGEKNPDDKSCCVLKNVTVKNLGIDRKVFQDFWKNKLLRKEELYIMLAKNAEFWAENVTFNGSHHYEVPEGMRLAISQKGNRLEEHLEQIKTPESLWHYAFDKENQVVLRRRP
jgi:UTP---glucose-1-phosphate uridylyltransferase